MILKLRFCLLFFFFSCSVVFAQSTGSTDLDKLVDVASSRDVGVLTSGTASDSSASSLSLDLVVCSGVARYSNLAPNRVILYTTLHASSETEILAGGVLLSSVNHPCVVDSRSRPFYSSATGVLDTLVVGLSSETVYYYRSFVRSLVNGDTVTTYGLSGSFTTPSRCGFRQIYAAGFCWMDRNLGDESLIASPSSFLASSGSSFFAGFPAAPAAPSSNVHYGSHYNFNTKSPSHTATSPDGDWTNDPCPAGFKVPALAQLEALSTGDWKWDTGYMCFDNNALCLPAAGLRNSDGSFSYVGTTGAYWSSEQFNATNGRYLYFSSGLAHTNNYANKSNGLSVRCVSK